MERTIFDAEHRAYRDSVRAFIAKEVLPYYDAWDRAGIVPRDLFARAGELGAFAAVPEEYGGAGVVDFRYNAVLLEEAARVGVAPALLGPSLQADVCLPYLLALTTEEQKQRWLPGIASGELIAAIAMTEPGTGSDLAGIRTRAVRNGDHYVVDGAKTFITNGINADLVIAAVRTGEHPHRGISLVVVERAPQVRARPEPGQARHARPGHRGAVLHRGEGAGREPARRGGRRLLRAHEQPSAGTGLGRHRRVAQARRPWTGRSTTSGSAAFGKPIGSFQATRFRLADLATEIDITQQYIDRCILELNAGRLSAVDAAKAKLWSTELLGRVIDGCLQLFGGYGTCSSTPSPGRTLTPGSHGSTGAPARS